MKPDYILEPDTCYFKAGFPDFNRPYECTCIQTKTDPLEKMNGKWVFITKIEVILRMKRLQRDAIDVDPQLENMEQEVIRIVEKYVPNNIVGYKDLIFDIPSARRIYKARDNYAKSDWRSVVRFRILYQKDDLT